MNAHLKVFITQANGDVNPKRFDGTFKAARKHKVKGDIVRPKGHNREKAWLLWSRIQRGQITDPASVAAIKAEYKELFKEFASSQAAAGRGSAEGA